MEGEPSWLRASLLRFLKHLSIFVFFLYFGLLFSESVSLLLSSSFAVPL